MYDKPIIIKGAKQHNLKNIDVILPRNRLIVITGLSGSGKSSLAFDTLYAEGQRRYVESLSAYARQFLGRMEKPHVESISGLSPAIAIQQRKAVKNPRSTVGTVTEVYDYLRLLFATVGVPYCINCNKPIVKKSTDEIVNYIVGLPQNTPIRIISPVVGYRKGTHAQLLDNLRRDGFILVRIDGKMYDLQTQDVSLDKKKPHTIDVIINKIIVEKTPRQEVFDSVELALRLSDGLVKVEFAGEVHIFSQRFMCPECNMSIAEVSPRLFSFNSPYGACRGCSGLGSRTEIDPELLIDYKRSLVDGALRMQNLPNSIIEGLNLLHRLYSLPINRPFGELGKDQQDLVLYGTYDGYYYRSRYGDKRYSGTFEGLIPYLQRKYQQTDSDRIKSQIEEYMVTRVCSECKGTRLRKESLSVKVHNYNIAQLCAMQIKDLQLFFKNLSLTPLEEKIASGIIKEIDQRLSFMVNVGVDYLTLDREVTTLSGGEAQRILLATQIGLGLVGVLYVLDEPSIGLHQRDNKKLLQTLCCLRDLGNTVVVVEHDEATIRTADYIVDLGPGAGEHGGYVVAQGTLEEVLKSKESITAKYLRKELQIPIPHKRKKITNEFLYIHKANKYNLKNIDVKIPLGLFVCITGVSGSGKSTLICEILYPALLHALHNHPVKPDGCEKIEHLEKVDKVINVDQSPIGRTPRSNPATYTNTFTYIRELYAKLPAARMRGYKPGRFSFNVKGGRCEACEGEGSIKIEMHFLPDVYVKCEVCGGRRFNSETLAVKYKGYSIADVLDMTVQEAMDLFSAHPPILQKLKTLYDVGLGYIKLGQPATTLSGGEAQRVKLAAELSKKHTTKTLYLLDEPTTGLHFDDINKLLNVLLRLRDAGNTVIVIEHNLDVIKTADYIIDLGPEGGDRGGEIVAEGTPEQVAMIERSHTGLLLRNILKNNVSSQKVAEFCADKRQSSTN